MSDRFAKVDKNLYRGGKPSANDLRLLKEKFDIERIVSLDGEIGHEIRPTCKKLDLEQYIIPLGDGNSPNLDYIIKNINKLFNKKTYLHCRHGKDRTGMVCAIYKLNKGADLDEVLKEANKFGMGSNLPKDVGKTYYEAVIEFSKNQDKNNANTAVDIQRENTQMNDLFPGVNNSWESNPNRKSFAPFSDPANSSAHPSFSATAGGKIYIFSNPVNVLKPGSVWGSRARVMQYLPEKDGLKLYSAELDSSANVKKFNQYYNQTLLRTAKINGADAVIFKDNVVFVFNPNALINIREEDADSNNVGDSALQVGQQANYDGLAPYSFPGSGGIMEGGYGGFAGPVQLPFGSF